MAAAEETSELQDLGRKLGEANDALRTAWVNADQGARWVAKAAEQGHYDINSLFNIPHDLDRVCEAARAAHTAARAIMEHFDKVRSAAAKRAREPGQ